MRGKRTLEKILSQANDDKAHLKIYTDSFREANEWLMNELFMRSALADGRYHSLWHLLKDGSTLYHIKKGCSLEDFIKLLDHLTDHIFELILSNKIEKGWCLEGNFRLLRKGFSRIKWSKMCSRDGGWLYFWDVLLYKERPYVQLFR